MTTEQQHVNNATRQYDTLISDKGSAVKVARLDA